MRSDSDERYYDFVARTPISNVKSDQSKKQEKDKSQSRKNENPEKPKVKNAYEIMVQFQKSKTLHTRFKAKNKVPETLKDSSR